MANSPLSADSHATMLRAWSTHDANELRSRQHLRRQTADLLQLTRSAIKQWHYSIDPYFRRGQRLIRTEDALGSTFVLFKPDAVAGRRITGALDFITARGFFLTAAATLRISPLLTREVWRYQFNIASWDRADVVDLFLPSCDALIVLLRDSERTAEHPLPAACRLSCLKGPADPASQRAEHLRMHLRGPTTLFNFIHTADEPADVVRELSLFDVATGTELCELVSRKNPMPAPDITGVISEVYGTVPAHDLDASNSWQRLAAAPIPNVAALARQHLASVSPNSTVSNGAGQDRDPTITWRVLVQAFPDHQIPAAYLWDIMSIATREIHCNVDGLRPIVPTVEKCDWMDHSAILSVQGIP